MSATTSAVQPSDAARAWTSLSDDSIDASSVSHLLATVRDDLWVTAACVARVLDDTELERALLELGLERSQRLVAQAQEGVAAESANEDVDLGDDAQEPPTMLQHGNPCDSFFATHEQERQACALRACLLARRDRLATYEELIAARAFVEVPSNDANGGDEDDPWADTAESNDDNEGGSESKLSSPIALSQFLLDELLESALQLASMSYVKALAILLRRHAAQLWQYRFHILQAVPEHLHPSQYQELLPRFNQSTNAEASPPNEFVAREPEWCETAEVVAATQPPTQAAPIPQHVSPLHADELSAWYKSKALSIEQQSGMVDIALAFIQYGASHGVPNLDALGEELSLLERLVYDSPQPSDSSHSEDWTLERWRRLDALQVVNAYLAHSSASNVADAIRRLVLPYLYVLEARAERVGTPDPGLPVRVLTEYLLDAPLSLVAAVFEVSKPILPTSQRILKDDAHMARVALACLYGNESLYEWSTMSRIFECLPAWEGAHGAEEEDEADTTLASLGAFVVPSASRPRCTPADLLLFFTPLPKFALSRALDVLDVHLDSGEILARWSVPAPLRWFLLSSDNVSEQRAYATRMAHRAGGGRSDELENEDQWEALKDDMLKLATSGKGPLTGPFGKLDKLEVLKIFFHGLLSAARFDIAKSLLNPSEVERPLEPQVVEELVLSVSQGFYDNASSGNLHHGDMKLAYDCLSVAPTTARIRKERDFIEATSRICSYHVRSRSGHTITPIEIRLEKDRLSLLARVLASTDDAYKHSQVMLDLANKLGVPGDARVYGMLADAALAAEDFPSAESNSSKMIASIQTADDAEVAWRTAFQLGRQAEWTDLTARLRLLAHAAKLCPPEHTPEILTAWRRVEGEHLEERSTVRVRAKSERRQPTSTRDKVGTAITSLASRLPSVHMPGSPANATSDAAARVLVAGGQRAAATLSRVAGAFPFGGGHNRTASGEQPRSNTPDMSGAARHALSRGVGWLIGDD